ncbi:solute carrier family 25 (peroxisomal adenine nucleotide transporter) member 17 [Microdochium nivale]|nr:solute carrier family 25 (peroxisomal adenine nucleotide transporter) member 17 [Microdochium nivale]
MAPPSSLAGDSNLAHILPALHHATSGSVGTVVATCTLYPLSLVIARLQVQRQLRRQGHQLQEQEHGPRNRSRDRQDRRGREGQAGHPPPAGRPRSSAASHSPRGGRRSPQEAATSLSRPRDQGDRSRSRGNSQSRGQQQHQPRAIEVEKDEEQTGRDGQKLTHVPPQPLGSTTPREPSSLQVREPAEAENVAAAATVSERASPPDLLPGLSSRSATRQDRRGPQTRRPSSSTSASSAAAGTEYAGIIDAFSRIYKEEGGLRALYAGLTQDAAKSLLDSFLFFMFYEWFRSTATTRRQRIRAGSGGSNAKSGLGVIEDLAVGMAAGAVSRAFTTPIANVVTRKQTASLVQDDADGVVPVSDKGLVEILRDIRQEKGLRGLWAGYSATLLLTLNPALTFFLQDFLKKALLGADRWDNPGPQLTFLLAASSKAAASAVTYPFQIAKTRLQAGIPVEGETKTEVDDTRNEDSELPTPDARGRSPSHRNPDGSVRLDKSSSAAAGKTVDNKLQALSAVRRIARGSIFGMIAQIVRAEGVGALYDGIQGELLKGFFSHGTTMLAKDAVHKLVFRLYLFTAGLLAEWRARQGNKAGDNGSGVGGGGDSGGGVNLGSLISNVRARLGNSLGTFRKDAPKIASPAPPPAPSPSASAPLPPALQYRLTSLQNQLPSSSNSSSTTTSMVHVTGESHLINLADGSHRVLGKGRE